MVLLSINFCRWLFTASLQADCIWTVNPLKSHLPAGWAVEFNEFEMSDTHLAKRMNKTLMRLRSQLVIFMPLRTILNTAHRTHKG
jgi:hypothetical protein